MSEIVDLRDRRPGDHQPVQDLVSRWFEDSHARLGIPRQQWFHPSVHELLASLDEGRDPQPALERLGTARGSAGLTLAETIADLKALVELLPSRLQPKIDRLATAAALSTWADAFVETVHSASCVDGLTGLATVGFLRVRLEQVYRHCRLLGLEPGDAHSLVVVRLHVDAPSPFTRLTHQVRVASFLRACFRGGETLTVSKPDTFFVLASAADDLDEVVGEIKAQLAVMSEELGGAAGSTEVWVEALPVTIVQAHNLIDQLAGKADQHPTNLN